MQNKSMLYMGAALAVLVPTILVSCSGKTGPTATSTISDKPEQLVQDDGVVEASLSVADIMLDPSIVLFVEKYCSDCHNDFLEDGDRSFDAFIEDPNNEKYHLTVEEILDQLNLGKMPKPGKDVLQPSTEERREITAALTEYLTDVEDTGLPVETPLRRLTRVEYENTMRYLLGIDPETSKEIAKFTPDINVHGFENLGAAQSLSHAQLGSYVRAAEEFFDAKVKRQKQPKLVPTHSIFTADDIGVVTDAITDLPFGAEGGPDAHLSPHALAYKSADHTYLDIGSGRVSAERPYYPRSIFEDGGVPADGQYIIRVKAEAINRFNDYDPKKVHFDSAAQPLKLSIGVAPNNETFGVVHALEREHIQFIDLPDDGPKEFEYTVRLNKGNVPFIFYPNGSDRPDLLLLETLKNYHPEIAEKEILEETGALLRMPTWGVSDGLLEFLREEYKGPAVRLHHLEIVGPFPLEVDEAIDSDLFKSYLTKSKSDIEETLSDFATKAYRRPTSAEDIQPYIDFVQSKLDSGLSHEEALKWAFTAILSSPKFLYLVEGNAEQGSMLDQYELASRLSYFLWSSMPDDALLEDASKGKLLDDTVIKSHVERMLKDEKAEAFVNGFINSWLRLDKLGSMKPDFQIYKSYYKNRLETAMRKETELLFKDVLHTNKPSIRFMDADFTYVNDALATHYGIEGDFGEEFKRVSLPSDLGRRGILGHASVLTASANGVDTSPVLRGVWVLENLLGTPPSPPPPDVPTIEPDTRGATTVRELIAKHRNVQACADCHAYIDPYGFPLEAFGPVGEKRERYPIKENGKTKLNQGALIDISTELATREQIKTLEGFHRVLLQNEETFQINLMSKLLTYATGREPTFRDRPQIQKMVDTIKEEEVGFLDMITMAATSNFFKTR